MLKRIYKGHKDGVIGLTSNKSRRIIISCSEDCTSRIWDTRKDRSFKIIKKDFAITKVKFFNENVFYTSYGEYLSKWDLRKMKNVINVDGNEIYKVKCGLGDNVEINDFDFIKEDLLMIATDNCLIKYDKENIKKVNKFHKNIINCVKVNNDNVFSGDFDGMLFNYGYKRFNKIFSYNFMNENVKFNPPFVYTIDIIDNETMAIGLGNGKIFLMDIKEFSFTKLLNKHRFIVNQVHFHNSSTLFSVGNESAGLIIKWNIIMNKKDECVDFVIKNGSKVNCITTIENDNNTFWIGDENNTIKKYTIKS